MANTDNIKHIAESSFLIGSGLIIAADGILCMSATHTLGATAIGFKTGLTIVAFTAGLTAASALAIVPAFYISMGVYKLANKHKIIKNRE
jgi:hypothetical protein